MGIRYQITKFKLMFVWFFLLVGLVFFMAVPALAVFDPSSAAGTDIPADEDSIKSPSTGLGNAFNTGPGSPLNAVAVQGAGYNTTATFESIIGQVITMTLGLLGVIFLILAIYGGFKWMTAAGNEEAVEKAKKTITDAILGMVIVLAAFVISKFIVGTLGDIVFK